MPHKVGPEWMLHMADFSFTLRREQLVPRLLCLKKLTNMSHTWRFNMGAYVLLSYEVEKRYAPSCCSLFKDETMKIGSYNTVRPRKPTNEFSIYPGNTKNPIFKIDEYHKNKNREVTIPMKSTGMSNVKTKKKSISAPVTKKLLYQVENYCDNTTLHGLRYVGDPTLSLCERLFWFCSFGIAACLAGYFISNIYVKWSESPVIISFSPSDADLNSIPFPSITICNMNQAKRQEAERIVADGTPAQKKLLRDYCNLNNEMNETEFETDWDSMQNFLITVGQSCGDMLKSCYWKNEKVDCDEYFNNDLTDEGLCCSFNRLPPNKIYWNPKSTSYLNQTYSNYIYDWNPEDGFPDKVSDATSEYIPRRPLGSGQHLGLSIILDTQVDNYYCSSTYSVGFKIVLANPLETPKTADFGFLLSPGVEARYSINPVIREATDSLRSVSIEKRQCYFSNERKLQYYRSYTTNNCYQECQSNYTLKMCGCIPYFLPQSKGRRICAKRDDNCVRQAQEDTNIVYGMTKNCDCLPGCAEVAFTKSGSSCPLAKGYIDESLNNFTSSYIKENIAVVHFFFFKHRYGKELKSEIYGFTDFLSNTGGLLGAFLGFSILSLVECFYYIFLKTFCLDLRKWKEARKRRRTKNEFAIQTYTERNCRLECLSNHTKDKCGCIPYFLPKARDVTTCSKKQALCQKEAKDTVEVSSEKGHVIASECNCLPGCYEVTYLKTGTYSNLKIEYYKNESEEAEKDYIKNTAVAHFFFEKSKFSKQVKSVVFGFTDLVSNCGGLLGLFVGFSLLSLIEFVYFLTIRLLCKKMRRPRHRQNFLSQRMFRFK